MEAPDSPNRRGAVVWWRSGFGDDIGEQGYDVVELTVSGNSCEDCTPWEGHAFSLTGATPGLPTKEDLIEAGVFHPNCTHSYTAVSQFALKHDYNADGSRKSDEEQQKAIEEKNKAVDAKLKEKAREADEARRKAEAKAKHRAHRIEQLERARKGRSERISALAAVIPEQRRVLENAIIEEGQDSKRVRELIGELEKNLKIQAHYEGAEQPQFKDHQLIKEITETLRKSWRMPLK